MMLELPHHPESIERLYLVSSLFNLLPRDFDKRIKDGHHTPLSLTLIGVYMGYFGLSRTLLLDLQR